MTFTTIICLQLCIWPALLRLLQEEPVPISHTWSWLARWVLAIPSSNIHAYERYSSCRARFHMLSYGLESRFPSRCCSKVKRSTSKFEYAWSDMDHHEVWWSSAQGLIRSGAWWYQCSKKKLKPLSSWKSIAMQAHRLDDDAWATPRGGTRGTCRPPILKARGIIPCNIWWFF